MIFKIVLSVKELKTLHERLTVAVKKKSILFGNYMLLNIYL
jgi:hypothetical protein